ncbi:MAG TPA: tetratricopeptide repeat protein [Ktedonobacteraceae bacterium]|jgi:tetratricopeptide (TPR) repeat protein|nr:tetratricopeptide repeat protein [Ktedonobacteraceae bacterium]
MKQTTLRDRIQNIEDAISAGHTDEAMASCQQLLTYFPEALEIQRLLGEIYLAQGRLDEAQQTFDWILVNDPENVIVYCDRALICESQNDIDTALDCYQQAYELSRGNSQIRQEFNQLSARVGQQEFMLSRAGLARLYMRGDLLTQAIQEWEAVLTVTPERLDARLGLLETYWREGYFDQVQQMATSILDEVPQCLKALLLLAHVTSPYNMQRAQDYLERAEALDPDMVMAQELFSDLAASQPHDPFLALIKREPVIVPEAAHANGHSVDAIDTHQQRAIEAENTSTFNTIGPTDRVYGWNDMESWRELDTTQISPSDTRQPEEHVPSFSTSWSAPDLEPEVGVPGNGTHEVQAPGAADFETWAAEQEIDDNLDPAILEQQPWFHDDASLAPPVENPAPANLESATDTVDTSWNGPSQQEQLASPPAWLEMLTRNEGKQPSGNLSALGHNRAEPSRPELNKTWEEDVITSPEPEQPEAKEMEPSFFFSSDDDSEMGWPEWLKSLGAETLEPGNGPEMAASPTINAAPLAQSQEEPAFAKWTYQQSVEATSEEIAFAQFLHPQEDETTVHDDASWDNPVETSSREPEFTQWINPQPVETASAEAEQLATLEYLEQSLMAQGFVPLQPGTLSSIAQEDPLSTVFPTLESTGTPFDSHIAPITAQEPVEIPPYVPPTQPLAQPEPVRQPALNLDAFAVTASAWTEVQQPQVAPPVPAVEESKPVSEPVHHQVPVSQTVSAPIQRQEPTLVPTYQSDALLDSELETTMKRPAVRLQPMQGSGKKDFSHLLGKGRTTERSGKGSPESLSTKERLIRGYQHQLVGDYDEAMQEYRIIIRNAPELLEEVISNVRALLKLAPRYSAGYRVLGDAYMRQGEYLQAMEAYNKALTIAKRAKGSGSH